MLIAQLSDLHFGTERPEVVEAVVHHIRALKPDVVALTGDITQRARAREFDAAARFAARLPGHRIVIPGNHDLPLFNLVARVLRPYAGYERVFGPRQTLWSGQGATLLTVDATGPLRHKNGRLPPQLLRSRLEEARRAAGPTGLLVLIAHQPLWTSWTEDGPQTLIGRDESAALIAQARVDVVLSGHVHVPLLDLSTVGFTDLPWTFVLSGAGTAVSHRTRAGAPNSFNTIRLEPGAVPSVSLARHDFAAGAFKRIECHRFCRGSLGWAEAEAEPSVNAGVPEMEQETA